MLSDYQLNNLNKMMATVLEPDVRSIDFFRTLLNEFYKETKDSRTLIQVAILISKAMAGGVVAGGYFSTMDGDLGNPVEFIKKEDYKEELHLLELVIGHLMVRTIEPRLSMDIQESVPDILKDCRDEIQKAVYKLFDRYEGQ